MAQTINPNYGYVFLLTYCGEEKDSKPRGESVIKFTQDKNKTPLDDIHFHFESLKGTAFPVEMWNGAEVELLDLTRRNDEVWVRVKRVEWKE